jgi:hypothetical protein
MPRRCGVSTSLTTRNDAPDIGCDAEAKEYIKTIRTEVYLHPRLQTGNIQPCPEENELAKIEWERRNVERTLAGDLSRYYQVPEDDLAVVARGKKSQKDWVRPALIKEGVYGRDHSSHQRQSAYLHTLQF